MFIFPRGTIATGFFLLTAIAPAWAALPPQIKQDVDALLTGNNQLHYEFKEEQAFDKYADSAYLPDILSYLTDLILDEKADVSVRSRAMFWAAQSRENAVTDTLLQLVKSYLKPSHAQLNSDDTRILAAAIKCVGFTNRDDVLELLEQMAKLDFWKDRSAIINAKGMPPWTNIRTFRLDALQGLANSGTERASRFFASSNNSVPEDMKEVMRWMPQNVKTESDRIKGRQTRKAQIAAKKAAAANASRESTQPGQVNEPNK